MNIFGIVLGWVRKYVDGYNNYVMARQEVEDSYQMITEWRRKYVNRLYQFAILSQDYINAHCPLHTPEVTISLATGRGNGQFYLTIANKLDMLHTLIWRTRIRTWVWLCSRGGKSIKSYGTTWTGQDSSGHIVCRYFRWQYFDSIVCKFAVSSTLRTY